MNHDEITAWIWIEPFGLLNAREQALVAAHRDRGCASCDAAARMARLLFEEWCAVADAIEPSAELRSKILESIRRNLFRN